MNTLNQLRNIPKEIQIELARQHQICFNARYFENMMRQKTPPFLWHWSNLLNFVRPDGSTFDHLILAGARNTAKTSMVRANVCKRICFKESKSILYGSISGSVSEAALYAVSTWLQSNRKLINDFGCLFRPIKSMVEKGTPRKTRMGDFVTTNGVSCQAFTLDAKNLRGFNDENFQRPDLLVFDDFENKKTIRSAAMTRNTLQVIMELLPALGGNAKTIWICNHISDSGVVQALLDMAGRNPNWEISNVAAIYNPYVEDPIKDGIPTWPERMVCTIAEAEKINAALEPGAEKVKSLEDAMNNMKIGSDTTLDDFYAEYLNIPVTAGSCLYDKKIIKKDLTDAIKDPEFEDGFWRIWEEPKEDHLYIMGIDTSEGVGRDHSAITIIDATSNPKKVVANYFDNRTDPNELGDQAMKYSELYNDAMINPEMGGVGIATVSRLKALGFENFYTTKVTDKQTNQITVKIGFRPNGTNKAEAFYKFKNDYQSGNLVIPCEVTLKEMLSTSREFLKIKRADDDILTRHLDLEVSAILAWMCLDEEDRIYRVA